MIGPILISWALFSATVIITGQTVDGVITDKSMHYDSEDGHRYNLEYKYTVKDRAYHGSSSTNKKSYKALTVGDHVGVKVLPSVPNYGQQLLAGDSPLTSILFLLGFGTVWMVIMLIPVHLMYVDPYIENKVMKNGKVCSGKITQKDITGEDSDNYVLYYEYEPSPIKRLSNKVSVSKDKHDVAYIGEPVNVLYDEQNNRHSVLYRYSDFELIKR